MSGSMSGGEDTPSPPEQDSFEALLDSTCSRLWERKLRYSLRRIHELAEILDRTDRELDDLLLCGKSAAGPVVQGPEFFKPPAAVPSVETARAGEIP
jgi:hypothetical protein